MELLRRAPQYLSRTAVIHAEKKFTYESLLTSSEAISAELSKRLPKQFPSTSSSPPRVGLYAAPGPEYVAGMWAIWRSGGICVPLATSHPLKELGYFFQDAGLSAVLTPPEHAAKLQRIAYEAGAELQLTTPPVGEAVDYAAPRSVPSAQEWAEEEERAAEEAEHTARAASGQGSSTSGRGALIIYTSGTTGRPKGVLHTVGSLEAQIGSLVSAWEWRRHDRILHALPLHHIHGVVNALYCAHHVGAAVHFLPKFSPSLAWQAIADGDTSVLMAVPTMYNYLLAHYDAMKSVEQQAASRKGAAGLRLAASGSSSCPPPIFTRWRALTGTTLLERYGMTETGMILSNPYRGERRPGTVGLPLPGVQVKIAEDGEVRVKSAGMFKEYWGAPEATAAAFDADGWYKTGDTGGLVLPNQRGGARAATSAALGGAPPPDDGVYAPALSPASSSTDGGGMPAAVGKDPYYTLFGRTSVDIIKSGGYKISALDIENVLLEHPGVAEVAVVGVPDETMGEVIWALLAARPGAEPGAIELRDFCAERLAKYQTPRVYRFVDALPRNSMGKLNKKELIRELVASGL